jgi:hypothetical protein
MACEDCDRARRNTAHRVFSLGCLWCGARYARTVRTAENLHLPAQVAGQQMSRRQWHEHVLQSWAEWGHDAAALKKLASADKVPFQPLEVTC